MDFLCYSSVNFSKHEKCNLKVVGIPKNQIFVNYNGFEPFLLYNLYFIRFTINVLVIYEQEKLKECEQSVRKYQQEVDSLSFRNQQLSTRVLFLQEELDQAETSKKKSKVIGFEEFFLDRNLYHLFQMISQ